MNRSSLLPDLLGSTKLWVIADLEKPLPSSVIVKHDSGNEVSIGIEIGRLPPWCGSCSRFGHSAHRCPEPQRKPPTDSHLPVDVISSPTVNSTAAVNSTTAVNTTAAIASTHPKSASSPPSNHLIDDPTSPSLSSSTAPSISAVVSSLPESLFPSAFVHNGGSLSVQNVSSFYPLENPNPSLAHATFSALFPPLLAQFVRHKSPKRMQISSQQTSSLKPIISGPQISSPSSLALKSPAKIASATSSLTSSHQSPITGSVSQSALATRSVSPPPPESSPIISYSTSATVPSAAPATISSAAISTAAVSPAAISFSSTTISLFSHLPASSKTPPPPPIIISPIPPSDDEDFITGLVSPTSDTAAPDVKAHIKTPFSIKNKIKELSQRQFEEEEEMIASSQRMKRQALLKEKSDTPSSSAKRKATKKKRKFDRLAALKASEALS